MQILAHTSARVYRFSMKISLALLSILAACTPCTPAPNPIDIVDECVTTIAGDVTTIANDAGVTGDATGEPICPEGPPTFVVGGSWGPCDVGDKCNDLDVFCVPTIEGKICLPACEQQACPTELECLEGTCSTAGTCQLKCDKDADCVGAQICDEKAGFCVYS
jgi:hypothetical protein